MFSFYMWIPEETTQIIVKTDMYKSGGIDYDIRLKVGADTSTPETGLTDASYDQKIFTLTFSSGSAVPGTTALIEVQTSMDGSNITVYNKDVSDFQDGWENNVELN